MAPFDVEAYFQRIGYAGPRTASLDTLAALHLLHPAAIPFENLDPLLRRGVRLDPASLQQKLLLAGRGGYCYEHNLLLAGILAALGFETKGLAARVLWNAPESAERPRSHMLLQVQVAGTSYIADVGFGGLTLTAPLRFELNAEQPTPHEPFRIVPAQDAFVLQARVHHAWRPLYRFGAEEHLLPDYEVANWYTSTHPASHFLTSLMVARVTRDRRLALLNTSFSSYSPRTGATERQTLASPGEIAAVLEQTFGITLPADAELTPALQRLCTPEQPSR